MSSRRLLSRCAIILALLATTACVTERVKPEEGTLPASPAGQAQRSGGAVTLEKQPAVSPSAISAAIEARRPRFRACYESRVMNQSRRPQGKVVTFFKVAPSGAVMEASVVRSSLKRPDVEACVLAELRQLQLPPPPEGGSYEIEYPFLFKPSPE